MNGAGRAKNKCRDFSRVFSRFLPFLHVFLYFESIFGDFLANFSQPALFFYFSFPPLEIFMKIFSETLKGVFSHHFLKMAQLSFAKVDFRNSFAACLFFPPHISPSGTAVVFCLARGCFRVLPKFRQSVKNLCFLVKNFIFALKFVHFHIG